MAGAVRREERARILAAEALARKDQWDADEARQFIEFGTFGENASGLRPPTAGEVAMLNQYYGGK